VRSSASAAGIWDSGGYDLLGVITGSEGLLGVVTEITVRILKKPETARALLVGFPTSEDAGACVGRIIGAGIIPGRHGNDGQTCDPCGSNNSCTPVIRSMSEALLIVELDGGKAEVDHLIERVEAIANDCRASTCRVSQNEDERLLFWAGRKAAFPAVGRISPDYYCMDGTIPRARFRWCFAHARDVARNTAARRQRVPCRRRQPASAHPL
jgi:glycolate oxidase